WDCGSLFSVQRIKKSVLISKLSEFNGSEALIYSNIYCSLVGIKKYEYSPDKHDSENRSPDIRANTLDDEKFYSRDTKDCERSELPGGHRNNKRSRNDYDTRYFMDDT
ncbi:hypothetical protein EJB05_51458, partial [Eragrostis curvula]